MKIGCGIRIRTVHGGGPYMIYWWYERENGRSVKREKYLGRVDDPEAREEGLSDMLAFLLRCRTELDRRIATVESDLAAVEA
ncbi:MAG TPA: hypothetical protein VJ397_01820 [Thermoplasmata archaeon]|nr:hypothetical protein [Thermoplasmata archaeon]